MKYTNPRTIWFCQVCGTHCNVLHEVQYGVSNRKIAVENSVQVPLCTRCHQLAHTHKEDYQRKFLDWLGLDYWQTIRAFNDKSLRSYLRINKEQCEEKIRSLEI